MELNWEKLFGDLSKNVTPFRQMQVSMFDLFSALAEQGHPDEYIYAMAIDFLSQTGMGPAVIGLFFQDWKKQAGA